MGKFDGYLLLSDFDGTLAHTEVTEDQGQRITQKAISRENCDAIRYFQSEGGLFTLATGRSFDWLEQWRSHLVPNTYVISYNGAVICSPDGKEELFSRPLEDFLPLAERIRAACPELVWVHFHSHEDGPRFLKDELIDPERLPSPIYKMVFYAHREQAEEYAARIASLMGDRYVSMRSWVNGIEVLMQGATKGAAIGRLKAALGERARTVVAVGDYENDADMIRTADIGYAMGNAVPSLKAVADRITVNANESAIAKIIADLEREC